MKEEKDSHLDALLEAALKEEPQVSLPYGFARMVVRKACVPRRRFIGYMKSLGLGLLLGAAMLLALSVLAPTFGKQIMELLFDWKYTMIFILGVITLIQYLDYKLKLVYR